MNTFKPGLFQSSKTLNFKQTFSIRNFRLIVVVAYQKYRWLTCHRPVQWPNIPSSENQTDGVLRRVSDSAYDPVAYDIVKLDCRSCKH